MLPPQRRLIISADPALLLVTVLASSQQQLCLMLYAVVAYVSRPLVTDPGVRARDPGPLQRLERAAANQAHDPLDQQVGAGWPLLRQNLISCSR